MSPGEQIYAAMRQTEMVNWVGAGDPAAVGIANFTCLAENLPLERNFHVLDFGCGIGRTGVPLAEFLGATGSLIGCDIIPGQIKFCRDHFEPFFKNVKFYCTHANNRLYDDRIEATRDATSRIAERDFITDNIAAFDLVVGFSVFTHFDPEQAAHYLTALRDMTKPGGRLFLTWFLDHPTNPADRRVPVGHDFCDPVGDLSVAVFTPELVMRLAAKSNLLLLRLSYGWWRGLPQSLKGQHFQDVAILVRPPELPPDFDAARYLAIHKDVAAAGMDAAAHYLMYGLTEGRRLR